MIGIPAAQKRETMVEYPTAAVPRARGMKLYLHTKNRQMSAGGNVPMRHQQEWRWDDDCARKSNTGPATTRQDSVRFGVTGIWRDRHGEERMWSGDGCCRVEDV